MPIAALLALLEAGLEYTPELIAACRTEYTLLTMLTTGTAPTAEQQAAMDAAQAAAHAAVQAG